MNSTLIAPTTPLGLLLVFGIAVLIPFLVDLVTKKYAESGVKSAVLLVFTLLAGVLQEALAASNAGQSFDWVTALTTALLTFMLSVGAFFGFMKPAKLAGSDGPLATPSGIGKVDETKAAWPLPVGEVQTLTVRDGFTTDADTSDD